MSDIKGKYICKTFSGQIKKYAADGTDDILNKRNDLNDHFERIALRGIYDEAFDSDYELID